MEVEKNIENTSQDSSDDDDSSKITTLTSVVEVNSIDSKENGNLYVGIYGNGVAYLKSVFYKPLRENRVLKVKFMVSNTEFPTRPKKLIAELFQIRDQSGNSLVLLLKDGLSTLSYITLVDYLSKNFSFKNVAIFNSINVKEYNKSLNFSN